MSGDFSKRADTLGIPEERRPAIAGWLDLLRQWNARIDLTAARSDDELYDLMLADAVMLSSKDRVAEGARVIDVGSGAGAPGLALALLRPDLKMTLVEPLTKRVSFMRTVLGSLGRTDITLVRERVEDTLKNSADWDLAMSRATLAPASWLPIGLQLAPTTWVLLAKEDPPEPEMQNATIADDVSYVWPFTQATRRAVRFARTARTQ